MTGFSAAFVLMMTTVSHIDWPSRSGERARLGVRGFVLRPKTIPGRRSNASRSLGYGGAISFKVRRRSNQELYLACSRIDSSSHTKFMSKKVFGGAQGRVLLALLSRLYRFIPRYRIFISRRPTWMWNAETCPSSSINTFLEYGGTTASCSGSCVVILQSELGAISTNA